MEEENVFITTAFLLNARILSGYFHAWETNPFYMSALMQNQMTKKIVLMAMMAALAFLVMAVIRIPVVMFLKYEPKDVIITIAGFIFGPLEALIIAAVVALIEMFTVSDTGWIGAVMNLVSTASFACVAALVYKKKHTLKGAVAGLVIGLCSMVIVMLLWNYLLTPIYMGYPREAVAAMLPTVFLPFNLLKGGLNAAITMLIYKPVVITLRKADLIPASTGGQSGKGGHRISAGVMIGAAAVLITCILFTLVLSGKI